MSGASVRTRKNVWTLSGQNDDLFWYGKAVAALKQRPITDPTSWRYMAAVHGYPGHDADPFAVAGEAMPSGPDQTAFWNQCQHHSWFFLPWHRAYLAAFEQIVADAVVQAGGPDGWALPYWNYDYKDPDPALPSDNPGVDQYRALPPAFQDDESALFVQQRDLPGETPPYILPQDASLNCLTHQGFDDPRPGDYGFGGPKTGFHHGSDGAEGWLEQVPHDSVHGDVGGFMGAFETAALDPIFWLHHANIDRLWEVWRLRYPRSANPADPAWLKPTPPFRLHDKSRNVWSFTPQDMLDTTKVLHGYRYDDVSDPLPHPAVQPHMVAAMAAPLPPELVAASDKTSIDIDAPSTTVRVTFDDAARKAATDRLKGARPARAIMNFENITGSGGSSNIRVTIEAAGASAGPPLLAGHISVFGLNLASRAAGLHGGSGLTKTLDVSLILERLQQGGWDGHALDVTFTPSRPGRRDAVADDLKLGRISIYAC